MRRAYRVTTDEMHDTIYAIRKTKGSFIMTSDAKIGLLLGLVFIFIIAFIINGMPNFRNKANNNELTTNMVSFENDSVGLGAKERKAQEAFNWKELVEKQSFSLDGLQKSFEKEQEQEQEIRSVLPIPQEPPIAKEQNVTNEIDIEKPKPVKRALTNVYIVREGDNLAEIAKKFYGSQDGNKMVNVTRIFQANRKLLSSPDDIYVGQRLVIPPLPTSDLKPSRIDKTLSDTAFERVESIGKRHLTSFGQETNKGRWYIVREGDSLWNIADKQLGNGSRYIEITKLNSDIIYNEDNIPAGIRLRMPAR